MTERQSRRGFQRFAAARETGMLCPWLPHANKSVSWTHMLSPDSGRRKPSKVSSAIRRHGSSASPGAQKNGLRRLWPGVFRLVRPQGSPGTRPVLRRHAHLPGHRGPARSLQGLRQGEARSPRLPRRQPALHPALCLVRGPALPAVLGQGRGEGAEPGLACGQGTGQAIHAHPTGCAPACPRLR